MQLIVKSYSPMPILEIVFIHEKDEINFFLEEAIRLIDLSAENYEAIPLESYQPKWINGIENKQIGRFELVFKSCYDAYNFVEEVKKELQ